MTEQRTSKEYAAFIKYMADEVYPQAEQIRIVQDNLNTHTPGALYKAFASSEARRLLKRLEFHYTPQHGSWLNRAEIEIGIIKKQCLKRGMTSVEYLEQEVATLVKERNERKSQIKWQFSCEQARTTLHRLYPKLEEAQTVAAAAS